MEKEKLTAAMLTDRGICPTCYNREHNNIIYGDNSEETHISKENNLPSLALDVCRARLAAAGQNAAVCAACPDTAVAVTVNAVGSTVMK